MSAADRDPVEKAVHELIHRLAELAEDCPHDDLWPGYKLTEQSRQERTRVVALLQEASRLLEQCIAREEPLVEPFWQASCLKEQRERAAKRGEASPLN